VLAEPTANRCSLRGRVGVALLFLVLASASVLLDLTVPRGRSSYFNRDAVAWEGQAWSLECGQIAGRDFVSTYGALSQLLARVAVRLHEDDDFLSSPPRIDAMFRWTGILCASLVLCFWNFERASQAALAGALWWSLGLPWDYAAMRPAAACLALLGAERLLRSHPLQNPWAGLLAGAICLAPAALTPDVSVFLVGAVVALAGLRQIGTFAAALQVRNYLPALLASGLVAIGFLLSLVLVELAFSVTGTTGDGRLGDFGGQTWRMMSTYSMTVGKVWDERSGTGWGAAGFVLATLAATALAARRSVPGDRARWLAVGLFSLTGLTGALIRSDPGHVALGLTPAALALGLATPTSFLRRNALGWCLALAVALASWPTVGPSLALPRFAALVTTSPSAAWEELRRGAAPEAPFPSSVLRAASASRGPIFPFPWQNHLGPASGRCLAQRFDQTYKAHDLELQRLQVRSLQLAPAGLSVWARFGHRMDQVQDVSRSPVVVEHLLEHYEESAADEPNRPWLELRRRETPRRLPWRRLPITRAAETGATISYRLADPASCGLLRLGLRFDYEASVIGIKSQRVVVRLGYAGEATLTSVLVPLTKDGRFDTWLETRPGLSSRGLVEDPIRLAPLEFDEIAFEPEPGDLWTRELDRIDLTSLDCL